MNSTVLITGATGGIGYEFVKLFAANNFHIIAVGRNQEELDKLYSEFGGNIDSEIVCMKADLSDKMQVYDLLNYIKGSGREIDVLVNNAASAVFGEFICSDIEEEIASINTNISAFTIITKAILKANGVIGIWNANSNGDDIEIYLDDSRKSPHKTINMLRQQRERSKGVSYMSLSDFVAPKETGLHDYVGGFAVTTGIGIEEHLERFQKDNDDYNKIMLQSLADRLAEAFAELMHKKVRTELWGYSKNESLTNDDLIKESYIGIRPAPGYPACPDHTEKITLFSLLDAENNTGIKLTESLAMYPAAAVSGLYFAHKDSRYFGIGKIAKDQAEDYAARKGVSIDIVEKWLSPNLGY